MENNPKWKDEVEKNMQKGIIALYLCMYFNYDEDFNKIVHKTLGNILDSDGFRCRYVEFKKEVLEKYPKLKEYIV